MRERRTVTGILLSLLFLIPVPAMAGTQPADSSIKEWTFIVYMCSDNNLEPDGIHDLNEMETVGSTDDINIIVQMDRTPGYDASNGDWTGTKRFYVTKDSDPGTIGSREVMDLGEMNMGNPQTFINFTSWAVDNYPARDYSVTFWDHGGGWYGVCWDDTDKDYLNLDNISAGLNGLKEHLGRPVDLVGFDACLMAEIEVLYQIRGACEVACTSGTTEPNEGWPYDWILPALAMKPDMTPAELAREITEDYVNSYSDGKPDPADTVLATMSSWDMAKAPRMFELWNQMSMRLAMRAQTYNAYLREVRAATEGYDPAHVVFLDVTNYPLYDVYDFCKNFLQPLGGPIVGLIMDAFFQDLSDNMIDLQKQILAARIAERHGPRYPNGYGLTAYFPSGNNSAAAGTPKTQYDYRYDYIDSSRDLYWAGFLRAFIDVRNEANTPPYVTIASPAQDGLLSADDGSVSIKGTAFDTASVMGVEVSIDNGSWSSAKGTSNWVYQWDLSSLGGRHTVSVRATDGEFVSPVVSRTFEIKPSTKAASQQGIIALAAAGILALAGVAAVLWAWRKGYDFQKLLAKVRPQKKKAE